MAEITALPGRLVPGTPFRRDQPVIHRGDRMLYIGRLMIPHCAPLEILFHGGGRCFVHIDEITEDRDERDSHAAA